MKAKREREEACPICEHFHDVSLFRVPPNLVAKTKFVGFCSEALPRCYLFFCGKLVPQSLKPAAIRHLTFLLLSHRVEETC
jgi:hypothetical protein